MRGFEITDCRRCGTIFVPDLPGAADSEDYGAYYDSANLAVPLFVYERLRTLVRSFDRHRRLNRWLDVGCGAGTLLRAARDEGWDVLGTEVAARPVEGLRSEGFDVRLGELGDLALSEERFDVVTAIEVLEHVAEPALLLQNAARLLRPGGTLYVTTPNARGVSRRLLGIRWSVVSPPEHLQLFSARGIRSLLADQGFIAISVHTTGVNPYELLSAVRRRQDGDQFKDRVETAYRLNESLSRSALGSLVKAIANGALSLGRLGDALKVTAQRPG